MIKRSLSASALALMLIYSCVGASAQDEKIAKTDAQIDARAGNGRVLAYLSAHADVYHQEFHNDRVTVRCYVPRFLVRHLQEPDVEVKMLDVARNDGTVKPDEQNGV